MKKMNTQMIPMLILSTLTTLSYAQNRPGDAIVIGYSSFTYFTDQHPYPTKVADEKAKREAQQDAKKECAKVLGTDHISVSRISEFKAFDQPSKYDFIERSFYATFSCGYGW